MFETSSSTGLINSFSESSGEIPVKPSETYIYGRLTSGADSLGILLNTKDPLIMMNKKTDIVVL
jgi:hypothetical protein